LKEERERIKRSFKQTFEGINGRYQAGRRKRDEKDYRLVKRERKEGASYDVRWPVGTKRKRKKKESSFPAFGGKKRIWKMM